MEETTGLEPSPALPKAGDVCPECHGRGWKVVDDGGAGTAVRCDCLKQQRGSLYLAQAGIPERYRRCRLSRFQPRGRREVADQLLEARRTCESYVERFYDLEKKRFRETGLIFIGPTGVGKTHLAVAVLIELIERYKVRGRFVDFTALLHKIRASFDPDAEDSKHAILDPIIEAEVLVLDELGAQKPTEWVMETLYLIMNTRYTQRRPTIFTTNYRLNGDRAEIRGEDLGTAAIARTPARAGEPLADRISAPLVSRIYEMAKVVSLTGVDDDYRRLLQKVKVGRL